MLIDRDLVRDIDIRVRLNAREFRQLRALAARRGLQFAALVRVLALEQAEADARQHDRKDAA